LYEKRKLNLIKRILYLNNYNTLYNKKFNWLFIKNFKKELKNGLNIKYTKKYIKFHEYSIKKIKKKKNNYFSFFLKKKKFFFFFIYIKLYNLYFYWYIFLNNSYLKFLNYIIKFIWFSSFFFFKINLSLLELYFKNITYFFKNNIDKNNNNNIYNFFTWKNINYFLINKISFIYFFLSKKLYNFRYLLNIFDILNIIIKYVK
jgi:hypothetical protein